MSVRNRIDTWGLGARLLHWSMAALFALQWVAGAWDDLFGGRKFHIGLGLLLAALTILRLVWRATNPTPALPESGPAWERLVAKLTYASWYLLMIVLPITGTTYVQLKGKVASFFGLWDVPTFLAADKPLAHTVGEVHETIAICFLVLLALHSAAAFKHHFIARDGILLRMLRG
ncbi:MAG: cytochrome b [Gammaproteobacteria bacterium]|nr:cytochrome b [Gammaproteobacteria bacterium]MBI5616015.1 cytochrome b [Gammaproteobacteria bacterium]